MATTNGCNRNLKELLAEWKLENILKHLSAEKIDVDILEMMKISHIKLLLYNFPLGVQIRFEYNLERWRRDNDRPLQMYEERYQPHVISKPTTAKDIFKQPPQMQSKITQTDLMILDVNTNSNKRSEKTNDISTCSRQSIGSAAATITTNQQSVLFHDSRIYAPKRLGSPRTTTKDCHLSNTSNSCIAATTTTTNQFLPPVKNTIDYNTSKAQAFLPKIDLRKILTLVPYGVELTNSYRERKSFTNAERRQLISVIVNYYLDNNIKFNLQTSYAIERSILQLFPNEKLHLYRTSKRGKLYSRYLSATAAMKFMRAGCDPNDNSDMDYGDTAGGDTFSMDNFSDDSQMLLVHNTADSMSHLDDDEDDDTFMDDDEYTIDFIGEGVQPTITEGEVKPDIKIEPEKVLETPLVVQPVILSTELLFNRRKPEEADRPFENFHVPWHKIPSDVLSMLEKQEKLGKRLNALANLFVDELRTICTHVPMRVFRNVTQQVVSKYPYSFLDRDSEGNIISSSTVPLMQRMRNRNNFLNR